ncbi:MAG: carboxypeptidase regulatory-like domain-containing protein, partial [Gammaproteobacteria bacterium]
MRISNAAIESQPVSTNVPASESNQSDSAKRRETAITGRVIDESGQAIPNAAINVRRVGMQANLSRSVGTDQDGRFRADDLTAGAYSVGAYAPGYVAAADSIERRYYRPGEAVTLRMVKGGVITGTVTNAEGEAMAAARVSAIRVRDGEGRLIRGAGLSGGVNTRQSDDRGVYRLYGLSGGTYLIAVNGGIGSYYGSSGYDGDAPTYHPSTTRDAAAEVIVHTGDEIRGIDVRYRGDRGYVVSGTLSGSLGTNSRIAVLVSLVRASSGAIESSSYTANGQGEFAVYGIPDGEYDLGAQMGIGTENAAASAARRVVVKGADVTGLDLSLAPLGGISGRLVLEPLSEAERKGDCKGKRGASPEETVIIARRDERAVAKGQSALNTFAPNDGTPDEKGEFKISSLIAGRYRIELSLPAEDWFVRSITLPAPAASKQNDVTDAGLPLGPGQRIVDLTATIAEGASALRGKVVAAPEGATLPSHLRVH